MIVRQNDINPGTIDIIRIAPIISINIFFIDCILFSPIIRIDCFTYFTKSMLYNIKPRTKSRHFEFNG